MPAHAPPTGVRSDYDRQTARQGLGLFMAFAAVCAVVALPRVIINRVAEADELRARIATACPPRTPGAAPPRHVTEHLHVAYTIAVGNPAAYRPDLAHVVSQGVALQGVPSTRDLQVVYYDTRPAGARAASREGFIGDTTPLRHDTGLYIHVSGIPSADDWGTPACSYERGVGGVCLVTGTADPSDGTPPAVPDLREAESRFESLLRDDFGELGGTSDAVQAACNAVDALVSSMEAVERLPLPFAVYADVDAALSRLQGAQGEGTASPRGEALAALRSALAAFESPHFITSTYFPPMHLFAVYLPLFFPIVATCLIGLVWEWKRAKLERTLLREAEAESSKAS